LKKLPKKFAATRFRKLIEDAILKKVVDKAVVDQAFNKVMDANITRTFTVCQSVKKLMIAQKSGSILSLSSVRGNDGLRAA
jgi:NAD(P)-dependent dehydrogenase (short-subunit alcohol dehydrogenase family)